NMAQALLGSKVKLRSPRGEDFIVTVPPGSQNGDSLRLRDQGLGGDLFIKLEVNVPKTLSDAQKKAFVDFADKMGWKY
ncbi:MAG: DnaJ C-terminal domain-containing protein, partial [Candidatus Rifleibacteriota bacterium]